MSSAGGEPRSAQQLLSRRRYRVRHSAWMLAAIFGFGLLTWVSFLYIGLRARRWPWLLAAIGYAVAAVAVLVGMDTWETNTAQSDWVAGALIAVWIGGIVHAMLVNPSWLRWHANRVPWYATGTPGLAPPPVLAPPPLPPVIADLDLDRGQYRGRPIDVNTAEPDALAALPGMTPERTRRALQERQTRGGFAGVAEFADATGLRPHEHYRIRALVTCSPHPRSAPAPGRGRVLDY